MNVINMAIFGAFFQYIILDISIPVSIFFPIERKNFSTDCKHMQEPIQTATDSYIYATCAIVKEMHHVTHTSTNKFTALAQFLKG